MMAGLEGRTCLCYRCHTEVAQGLPICPVCRTRAPQVYTANPLQYQPVPTWSSDARGQDVYHHNLDSNSQGQNSRSRSSQVDFVPLPNRVPFASVKAPPTDSKHAGGAITESVVMVADVQNKLLCQKCRNMIQHGSKFCSECGAKIPGSSQACALKSIQSNPSEPIIKPINLELYSSNECYFCGSIQPDCNFRIAHTGKGKSMLCHYCSKTQPRHNPQGPPCIYNCGARLIKPDAKLCGRCGKNQRRRLQASLTGTNTSDYGYSNSPTFGGGSPTYQSSSLSQSQSFQWVQPIPTTTGAEQQPTPAQREHFLQSATVSPSLQSTIGQTAVSSHPHGAWPTCDYGYPNSSTFEAGPPTYPGNQSSSLSQSQSFQWVQPIPTTTGAEQQPTPVQRERVFQSTTSVTVSPSLQTAIGKQTAVSSSSYPHGGPHAHDRALLQPVQETVQKTGQHEQSDNEFGASVNVNSRKRKMPNDLDNIRGTPDEKKRLARTLKTNLKSQVALSDAEHTPVEEEVSDTDAVGEIKSINKLSGFASDTASMASTIPSTAAKNNEPRDVMPSTNPQLLHSNEGDMYRKQESAPELFSGKEKSKKKDKDKHKVKEASRKETSIVEWDGINAPHTNSLKLTFHVLVPKPYWEWDETSSIHIRFGHPKLGSWTDSERFQEVRCFDGDVAEMVFTFKNFNKDILQSPLPYKYVVHSPKSRKCEETDCYEFIQLKKQECNRCLDVPAGDKHFASGEYHKYDTVAYPRDNKVSKTIGAYLLEHAPAFVGKLFKKSKDKEGDQEEDSNRFTPLPTLDMCMYSLECYLTKFRNMLCIESQDGHDCSFQEVALQVSFIYRSLLMQCVCPIGDSIQSKTLKIGEAEYKDKLKEWFESVIIGLKDNNVIDPAAKLTSAACILYCITTTSADVLPSLDVDAYLLPLAGMLKIHPDRDVKSDCQHLCSHIPPDRRSTVGDAISNLCLQISNNSKHFEIDWLLPISLYHFLLSMSQPYGPVTPDLDIEWKWYNAKFGLASEHQKAQKQNRFVATHYDQIKSHFAVDPLLLKVFIFVTPRKEFVDLCTRIPAYLSSEVLIRQASKADSIQEKTTWSKNLEELKLAYVRSRAQNPVPEDLLAMVWSSLRLCSTLSERLLSSEDSCVKLLSSAFSCTLHALENARLASVFEKENCETTKDKVETQMKEILNKWISHEKVIGGSVFGHTVRIHSINTRSRWKGRRELEVWQCLLSINMPQEYQSLKDWHNVIKVIAEQRLYTVSAEEPKIELVIEMEKMENIHPVLEGIVMDAALKAIDSLLKKSDTGNEVEMLAKEESKRVGKLLARIFDKKYPGIDFEPTLTDLFEWIHWARYIKICYSKQRQKLRQGFSRECIAACSSAKKTIMSLCERLHCGGVSINEIKAVGDKEDRLQQLFESCSDETDSNKKTEALVALQTTLMLRKEEYDTFVRHRRLLQHLCRFLHDDIEGIEELKCKLENNSGDKNLNELCSRDGNEKVKIVCFESSEALCTFVDSFYVLSKDHPNDVFPAVWKKFLASALEANPNLGLGDMYSSVWLPCFNNCKQLLLTLSDLSIPLAVVDQVFKDHESSLETQLLQLFNGVSKCTQGSESFNRSFKLIERAVHRIKQYWKVCGYRKQANTILRIRRSLGLHQGNFSPVEKISKELAESGECQTLGDVDDRLVGAGVFLEDVANDKKKVQCLETFARCKDIVQWLKGITKDVTEIQHFVNVALTTAAGGEGDLSHDRLSVLRTVGSGFASLIYGFPEDSGFVEFKEACTFVWEALEKNEKLPTLLEDCNKDVEWYQSVKDTQGSVEVTSYGQMRNILQYGRYQVGTTLQSKTVHGIHDLISLKLIRLRDKKVSKTVYSLDDLRDLESKLVLITGSKAENRTEVDHYLNVLQYVTRIAEVLLALQQAGNVAFTGWAITIDCAEYIVEKGDSKQVQRLQEGLAKTLVDKLSTCSKEMEQTLKDWNNKMKESRSHYYELNYYTARQLLLLRRELRLTENNCESVNPVVMSLLHSISQDVTPECVHSAVSEVCVHSHPTASSLPSENLQSETACMQNDALELLIVSSNAPGTPFLNAHVTENTALPEAADSEIAVPISENIKPQLTEHDINANQLSILNDLVEQYHYSKHLVLRAIEACNNTEDEYEIQTWCDENCDQESETISVANDDSPSESEYASSESDGEPENVFHKHSTSGPSASNAAVVENNTSTSSEIRVVHRQVINEFHPLVQQLVKEYDYDLEDSIDAVSITRNWGTIDKAMDYLAERDAENYEQVPPNSMPAVSGKLLEEIPSESGEHVVIYDDDQAETKYLSLDELGAVLRSLSKQLPESVKRQRSFLEELKTSSPNLIVSQPADIWRTVLTLYMEDEDLPLPTFEEVLVCSSSTTAEEITLFWQRAIGDPGFKRIFCLVHAEVLSYQTCDNVIESLKELSQGKQGYRLVIVCSKEAEHNSHIVSKLLLQKRSSILKHGDKKFQKYLRNHFIQDGDCMPATLSMASSVDYEHSCVRVVSSDRTGMGKSLYIQRMAEQLQSVDPSRQVKAVIPIHGPLTTADVVLNFLKDHYKKEKCNIYHFDVAPNVLCEVDTILFSLLILHGLTDSQGCVWRCHPAELYVVEATMPSRKGAEDNTHVKDQTLDLLHLLPQVECLSPIQALQTENQSQSQIGMDEKEFTTPTYQRAYQYLRRHAHNQSLDHFSFSGYSEGTCTDCLQLFIKNCGVQDPSWSEIHHFAKFLDLQLEACEKSVFCDTTFVGDVMAGFKSFVVKFMITMSRDFATPSLRGEVTRGSNPDQLEKYEIEERRRWEESSHPYIFFNKDGNTLTFIGFIITRNGDLIYPSLQARFMDKQLFKGLSRQGVDFSDDFRHWSKATMIQKLSIVMGLDYAYDPDDTYVLTVDNLIKILAIQMRFRCGIPVVIMGETGCGKTRLIRYMCDLARLGRDGRNMLIMKIHGGTKESDIVDFIDVAEKESKKNKELNIDTIVFFDEANTTDALGMIKEIMCDQRIHGRPVSDDLKFIAACNPYRKHSDEMIRKLETAGLGFYIQTSETQQRLGNIPLRQLVYRVLDLPQSMRPLVYDFGQLKKGTEEDYIKQIVHDHIRKHTRLSSLAKDEAIEPVIVDVLVASQSYMRKKNFVSLRDVERAMIVFEYFYEKIDDFRQADQERKKNGSDQVSTDNMSYQDMSVYQLEKLLLEQQQKVIGFADNQPHNGASIAHEDHPNITANTSDEDPVAAIGDIKKILREKSLQNVTSALILAVSVCYHARLQERTEYENTVASKFATPIDLPTKETQFRNEIVWCQNVLLDNMELGKNIAKNAALRENVFMMAICIELRIPLFLVGKPGSSKSLAKSIIQDSMHGKTSRSNLLKKFKQVQILSYQCSQLATPESVIEVFTSAKKFQSTQDTSMYVSVVVLDEVGLAEDSPNLPLKALHPLLEDGTEGAGAEGRDEVIEREKRVAFIGISNWALDPAKMNRGVMVIRGSPDIEELKFSAVGICGKEADDTTKEKLEPYFKDLAKAYEAICAKQDREFFGLRDFYSLIKMLYWMCENSKGHPLTSAQLEHAIKRNFGGLESSEWNPFEEFKKRLNLPEEELDQNDYDDQTWELVNPDCSRLALIKTSLATKEITFHGENRYLLFLTENYAALDILEHYIRGNEQEGVELSHNAQVDVTETSKSALKPFTLFGSSFPKDKEYTQVCRNINQIKICMETGRTVILLNLENLYESLYDVLNQYYMRYGDNRYVDLGLQTHRVKCRVHKDFKLILIAERHTVYEKFPTPLINRLEKHFVLTSSVLKQWQLTVLSMFQDWIQEFSVVRDDSGKSSFKEGQAFIGYQKDTPAAVVFQASKLLKQFRKGKCGELLSLQKYSFFKDVNLAAVCKEKKGSMQWKLAVLKLSQTLLLQIASDDALIRLKKTTLAEQQEDFLELYFSQQCHSSVVDLVNHYIRDVERSREGLLMQVTTHGHLLQREEVEIVENTLHMKVEALPVLQEFDTELDFTNTINPLFQRDDDCLLIIQCDAGHVYGDLVACARYRIYDERVKALKKSQIQARAGVTHVLLIINLPHHVSTSSFVGFQGEPWVSYHIDDLMPTLRDSIEPLQAIKKTISDLFIGSYIHDLIPTVPPLLQTHISVTESENSSESHDEPSSSLSVTDHQESETKYGLEAEGMDKSNKDEDLIARETQNVGDHSVADTITNKADDIKGNSLASNSDMKVIDIEDVPVDDSEFGTCGDNESKSIPHSKENDLHVVQATESDEMIERGASLIQITLEMHEPSQTPSNQEERLENRDESILLQIGENQAPDLYPCPQEGDNPIYHSSPDVLPVLKQATHITPFGQCRRLYGCIHAAASKLEDMTEDRSTQRVSRLTKLIPRCPTETIDPSSFYGVVVMYLYNLLREREAVRPDLSEWVLSEALNISKLEVGGTFRNVLARKIDEVVIPIFAKMIACIDCYYNLDLIDPKSENSPVSQFWLAMFRRTEVLQLKYSEMVQGDTVPGVGGRKAKEDFKCKMPFFWLIKDDVDSQWDIARSTTDTSKLSDHNCKQLGEFILATCIGETLGSVSPDKYEEFYLFYLHDFVKSVHSCNHRNSAHDDQEYQLISNALNLLVHCSEVYQKSLISRIAALHIAYWENRQQILWFGQLVSHFPSIMESLQGLTLDKSSEMELHLIAAIKVMEKLEPPLKKDNPNPNLSLWLNRMRLHHNAINSILTLQSKSKLAETARCCWLRLCAAQLFVEHVMVAHPSVDLKITAKRMCKLWERNVDFCQAKTIRSVQLQLNSMEKMLKQGVDNKHKIKQIKKSCRQFFVGVVSELTFGGPTVPEPELIKMLLGTIFVEKHESTQELTPYKDDKSTIDKIPTVRSFLLQQLLEHSLDQVRGHLHDYLDKSHSVLSSKAVSVDQDLYLLVIQCLEDSLNKKFSANDLQFRADKAPGILLEGYYALTETGNQETPSFEYLQGIAKVRFALSVMAEVLNTGESTQLRKLLKAGETVCSDRKINCIDTTGQKNTVGPIVYLLKLMVRHYGMPCLKAAAETIEWLIPAELKSEEEKLVDPFAIYDDNYKKLRESINDAMYGNQLEELDETTKNLNSKELVYLLLAFYEKATLSRTSENPARRINNEALERLNEFVLNYQHFPNELRLIARALLANHQGGVLKQMVASPQQTLHCRNLMGVVVHAVAIFYGRQGLHILLPFVNILNDPAALNRSFLPTMPEDQVIETQDAMRKNDPNGKFYECPRGHKYFVGDCGGVMSTGECNVCRASIGGQSYNLQPGNQPANLKDATKKGHDLGDPNNRTETSPERDLSPRAVCILRALLHSAFIWASCNNDQALGAIAGLVQLNVQPQQLPEFFWLHLEKDLELLGKETSKGLEETVMIIHLVLRQILTTNPPTDAGNVLAVNTLETKEARKRWEDVFNQHYIQPVLANLDNNLTVAMDIVAKDDQQDHDHLFFLVYEKVQHVDDSLQPHLWTYRSRITLEHLRQSMYDKKLAQAYPILYEFLQTETDLRAMQYLPEIIHLQRCLYDKFNRQIDRKDTKKTVAMFIQSLPNETVKNDYRRMIHCLKAAWGLVGHKLKTHGRIPVEEKFYIAQIDDSTAMEYLVPTTSEAGVCTTALVDYLIVKHNHFIERCRSLVGENDQSILSFWREHKIPISHLHHCHLVIYEKKLPAIILSHCQYSLKVGKGQDIKYDYPALEKHILNKFIHGKPIVILDIPQVVYKRDIYTTKTFAAVRKKVAPQEMLPQRIRQDIIMELCSPDRLREALDVVEIILGFLSSGGGKAEKPLGEYIDKTLRMKRRHFSMKAKTACQLKHILSLWETIAVELAQQLCLREQEPFDSIRKDFLRELSHDEDGEDQFTALDSCLGQFDPDTLLGTLFEFIETYVKHASQQEQDESLVETLELVLEHHDIELPHLKVLPASIKLDQAVATWKHIVHHYAKKK